MQGPELPCSPILTRGSHSLLRQDSALLPEPTASAESSLCDWTLGPKGLLAPARSSLQIASTLRPLLLASSSLPESVFALLLAKQETMKKVRQFLDVGSWISCSSFDVNILKLIEEAWSFML